MVTIAKVEKLGFNPDDPQIVELRGLAGDTKPTEIGGIKIGNGSIFIEIDTGNMFLYDEEHEEWKAI